MENANGVFGARLQKATEYSDWNLPLESRDAARLRSGRAAARERRNGDEREQNDSVERAAAALKETVLNTSPTMAAT
jgi:hypothetical protein